MCYKTGLTIQGTRGLRLALRARFTQSEVGLSVVFRFITDQSEHTSDNISDHHFPGLSGHHAPSHMLDPLDHLVCIRSPSS